MPVGPPVPRAGVWRHVVALPTHPSPGAHYTPGIYVKLAAGWTPLPIVGSTNLVARIFVKTAAGWQFAQYDGDPSYPDSIQTVSVWLKT